MRRPDNMIPEREIADPVDLHNKSALPVGQLVKSMVTRARLARFLQVTPRANHVSANLHASFSSGAKRGTAADVSPGAYGETGGEERHSDTYPKSFIYHFHSGSPFWKIYCYAASRSSAEVGMA